jgi:hypothetical protein
MILLFPFIAESQMITGVWKGRINRQKVEVKIIQNGDSLKGTSYYYESAGNYRRYNIKGYYNSTTNEAIWWDDELIQENSGKLNLSAPGRNPMLSSADFNCPGDGRMMLDGKTVRKNGEGPKTGEVHLDKTAEPVFEDEWDYVIENYLVGTNDPELIDSLSNFRNRTVMPLPVEPTVGIMVIEPAEPTAPVTISPPLTVIKKEIEPITATKPLSIEEKFSSRKKLLVTEIPIRGDSIELRFYDNAEIDGDSISLFLNGKLVFNHIRLTGNAYTIKLAVAELDETNELIMVAENLGSIPPNTSYMVAIVGQDRYEARLESTEGSSAMVRFVKKE